LAGERFSEEEVRSDLFAMYRRLLSKPN
jgi:hypothetical protein